MSVQISWAHWHHQDECHYPWIRIRGFEVTCFKAIYVTFKSFPHDSTVAEIEILRSWGQGTDWKHRKVLPLWWCFKACVIEKHNFSIVSQYMHQGDTKTFPSSWKKHSYMRFFGWQVPSNNQPTAQDLTNLTQLRSSWGNSTWSPGTEVGTEQGEIKLPILATCLRWDMWGDLSLFCGRGFFWGEIKTRHHWEIMRDHSVWLKFWRCFFCLGNDSYTLRWIEVDLLTTDCCRFWFVYESFVLLIDKILHQLIW